MLAHAVREVFAHGPDKLLDSGRPFSAAADPGHAQRAPARRGRASAAPQAHAPALPRRADEGLRADHRGVTARDLGGGPRRAVRGPAPHAGDHLRGHPARRVPGVEAGRLDRLRRALRELLSWTTRLAAALVFGFLGPERVMALRGFAVGSPRSTARSWRRSPTAADGGGPGRSARTCSRCSSGGATRRRAAERTPSCATSSAALLVAGHGTTARCWPGLSRSWPSAPALQRARLAAGEDGLAEPVVAGDPAAASAGPWALRRLRSPLQITPATTCRPARPWPRARAPAPRSLRAFPDEFAPTASPGEPPYGRWRGYGGGVRRCVGATHSPSSRRAWCWPTWPGASSPGPPEARRSGSGHARIVLVRDRGAR